MCATHGDSDCLHQMLAILDGHTLVASQQAATSGNICITQEARPDRYVGRRQYVEFSTTPNNQRAAHLEYGRGGKTRQAFW